MSQLEMINVKVTLEFKVWAHAGKKFQLYCDIFAVVKVFNLGKIKD